MIFQGFTDFGHLFHTNRCSQPKKWFFVDRTNVRWAPKIHFSKILNTWDTYCNPRSVKIIKILRKLQKIMFFRFLEIFLEIFHQMHGWPQKRTCNFRKITQLPWDPHGKCYLRVGHFFHLRVGFALWDELWISKMGGPPRVGITVISDLLWHLAICLFIFHGHLLTTRAVF